MIRAFVILASLLVAGGAYADRVDLERRLELLAGHHARLDRQLVEQGKRIRRLKTQQRGVGRDYQLRTALRSSQALAERLTRLRGQMRRVQDELVKAYDQAIARASDAGQRRELRRRRARLLRPRSARGGKIVTSDEASPYDSPDDLEEKADLLQDSEEKVRRRLRQVERRLVRLERVARLQRHSRAADDSPFVESAPRRTSRTRGVARATTAADGARTTAGPAGDDRPANQSAGGGAAGAAPPPAAPASPDPGASGEFAGAKSNDTDTRSPSSDLSSATGGQAPAPSLAGASTSATPAASGTVSVTVREVLDPGFLGRLQREGKGGDLRARIAALKKAAGKLDGLATGLSGKARCLRKRAKSLRTQK